MLKFISVILVPVLMATSAHLIAAENIIEDQGVGLTYEELAYQVSQWTPQMQDVAANDMGDRLELLNKSLLNKKLAARASAVLGGLDSNALLEYQAGLESYQRNFVLRQFADGIVVPDVSALAQERYETQREKYALVNERRLSSHILFVSPPGQPRDEITAKAQKVLDELRAGADFQAMVAEYSDEPGAAEKKGKFDRWIELGESGVSPPYTGGVFEIENVGEYSELVGTQFGVHIIRLDGIQEAYFKPFDEVKDKIVEDLESEYKQLAMKDYLSKLQLSDKAYIDGDAMDKLFAPYQRK